MRQFLVRVDSSGDLPAFTESMRDKGLVYGDADYDRGWLDEVLAGQHRLVDARYLIVTANTEAEIHTAIETTARYALDRWPEGRPVFAVLADREPPSYLAHGTDPS